MAEDGGGEGGGGLLGTQRSRGGLGDEAACLPVPSRAPAIPALADEEGGSDSAPAWARRRWPGPSEPLAARQQPQRPARALIASRPFGGEVGGEEWVLAGRNRSRPPSSRVEARANGGLRAEIGGPAKAREPAAQVRFPRPRRRRARGIGRAGQAAATDPGPAGRPAHRAVGSRARPATQMPQALSSRAATRRRQGARGAGAGRRIPCRRRKADARHDQASRPRPGRPGRPCAACIKVRRRHGQTF